MLIGTFFRRPKAPVDMGDGTIYFFLPRDPSAPEGEHVCEVNNNTHIQRLLSIPEGYYIAQDEPSTAAPAAPRPTPQPQPPANTPDNTNPPVNSDPAETTPATPATETTPAAVPEEIAEAAANLVGLSWQAIIAQTKKGGIPKAVLAEALRLEQAKPEDERRSAAVKALTGALEAV